MATLNREQVIGMIFHEDVDSGGDSEIEEDQAFPLPVLEQTLSPAISSDEDLCENENVSPVRESQ